MSIHKFFNLYFAQKIKIIEILEIMAVNKDNSKFVTLQSFFFKYYFVFMFPFCFISFVMLVVVCVTLTTCISSDGNKILLQCQWCICELWKVYQCFIQMSHRPLKWELIRCFYYYYIILFFNFTILYWFCHISTLDVF